MPARINSATATISSSRLKVSMSFLLDFCGEQEVAVSRQQLGQVRVGYQEVTLVADTPCTPRIATEGRLHAAAVLAQDHAVTTSHAVGQMHETPRIDGFHAVV